MSDSRHILEDFTYPLSACPPKADLDRLLTILQSSQYPHIAIVNDRELPIGIVNGNRLLTFLIRQCSSMAKLEDENIAQVKTSLDNKEDTISPFETQISDLCEALVHSFELTPWMEPIVTLKSDLSREKIHSYFAREISVKLDRQNYVVVDSEGKLLGLLDSFRLTQWLFFHPTKVDYSSRQQRKTAHLRANNPLGEPKLAKKPLLNLPLFDLIEKIPVPLMLQTQTGKALYKNKYWQEQIRINQISHPLEIHDFVNSLVSFLEQIKTEKNQQNIKNELTPYCQKGNYYLAPSFANLSPKTITFESIDILNTVVQEPSISSVSWQKEEKKKSSFLGLYLQSLLAEKYNDVKWQYIKIPLDLGHDQLSRENLPKYIWLFVAIDISQQEKLKQDQFSQELEFTKINHFKDEFLASIGHELKSPLTAIIGLSNLLKKQKLGELNQRQIRYAELIYRSGRQLMKIVNDMLELTYLSTGELKLNLEYIHIKALCEEAYKQALTGLEDTNNLEKQEQIKTKFQLNIKQGLDIIVADRVRLRQILIYLLDNALKFTQIDQVKLSKLEKNIGISINRWSSWIAITIWDNGNGIAEEEQHLILEQYLPSENYLDRYCHNKRLELILTQQLARAHGGDISFISHIGQGNKFTVLLPSYYQQISSATPPNLPSISSLRQSLELSYKNYQHRQLSSELAIAPESKQQNLLVLIIESVVARIKELDIKLRELGYYPIIARTDTEAFYKAKQLQPSNILLNPHISQSSSLDILSLLKSDPHTNKIPVFLMVTSQEKQDISYSQADGLLTLPIELEKLRELISSISKEYSWTQKRLTILHLYPESEVTSNLKITRNSDLNVALNEHLSGLNHRVLEADSLEQGELLSRIWQLDAIVLDGSILQDPFKYLSSLREIGNLSSLPLITLDAKTTEAANLIEGLSVFPCLLPEEKNNLANLVEVIQIAAGIESNQ